MSPTCSLFYFRSHCKKQWGLQGSIKHGKVFTDLTSLGSSEVFQLERVWRSFSQLQEFDIKVSQNALLHKKHEKSYHLLQTGPNLFM
jgi:hypothetical protein